MPLWIGQIEGYKLGLLERTVHKCVAFGALVADIVLPMDAATIDVTRVEVALRLRFSTTAIYRSSPGVVTLGRPATGLRTTVWLVRNCFHNLELTE